MLATASEKLDACRRQRVAPVDAGRTRHIRPTTTTTTTTTK